MQILDLHTTSLLVIAAGILILLGLIGGYKRIDSTLLGLFYGYTAATALVLGTAYFGTPYVLPALDRTALTVYLAVSSVIGWGGVLLGYWALDDLDGAFVGYLTVKLAEYLSLPILIGLVAGVL